MNTFMNLLTLALAAQADAPGPWEWWTSNSFRRLSCADGRVGGVLSAVIQRSDGHPDIRASAPVAAFIEASSPDAIITLCERVELLERLLRQAADYIEGDTDPRDKHPESERIRKAAGL